MAIEKMKMVDMIGPMDDLEKVAKSIVLSGNMQVVNTMQQINATNFKFSTTEENVDRLIDVCSIKPFAKNRDNSVTSREIKKLKEAVDFPSDISISSNELILDYSALEKKTLELSGKFADLLDEKEKKRLEKEQDEKAVEHLKFLTSLNLDLADVHGLTHFIFELYRISEENLLKLKSNYENTPSVVIDGIYRENDFEVIMSFTPVLMKTEADRFFKSLNCELIELPSGLKGTAEELRRTLSQRAMSLETEIKTLDVKIKELAKGNKKSFGIISKSMELETRATSVMENAACTKEFFYLSGWVPEGELSDIEAALSPYEVRLIFMVKDSSAVEDETPPTKLKNNKFVRPFEAMVGMYGTPSYNELDPTTFLGITYMILFGMMFGDLGQGLVFVFVGLFLTYKKHRPNFGGVLTRLGVCSSIFGVVYGSFFGFEEVLPDLGIKPLIRPMENINQMLVYAIIFGVALLFIGYIFGFINAYRRKDIENGLLGKDGVVGFVFYILILTFLILKLTGKSTGMPDSIWYVIFIILLGITVVKQPLANKIKGKKKLYEDSVGDYYVEAGFGVFETLLSMFSNTVSFVRVGAFALNHVGLFMAFSALAKMMNGGVGGVFMYILGNVLIIGLEGLIVFIQGLRLEYYELFSKYYEGAGSEFTPVKLDYDRRLKIERKLVNSMNTIVVNE